MKQLATCVLAIIALPLAANAETVSANFCSVANVATPPAGVVEAMIWNDFTSAAGFGGIDSSSSVLDESGALTGLTVSWGGSAGISQNTNDEVMRPTDLDDGHDELMTGYLQASRFGTGDYVPTITLDVMGIDVASYGGSYDVLLYFDGDNDIEGEGTATFSIDDGVNAYTVYGRDAGDDYPVVNDGTMPLDVYAEIVSVDPNDPTIGNYVHFTGLTESSFSVALTGTLGTQGVALNGFQITPEPASLLLVALGALLRRR